MNFDELRDKKNRKDIYRIAKATDFEINETDTHWQFRHGQLEIDLKKSKSLSIDRRRADAILNEALGQGYSDSGSFGWNGEPYCEYKIIPLNHDLEQKVPKPRAEDRGYSIQVGSFVIGKSKKDDKEYSGIVQRFVRTNYNDIVTVYILARENGRIVPLDPDSVQLSSPFPNRRYSRSKMNMGNLMIDGVGAHIGGSAK